MFDAECSLNNILVSLESVLKLEIGPEMTVQNIVDTAIRNLENTNNFTLTSDLYTVQAENALSDDKISMLLRDMEAGLERLSFFVQLKLYHKNVPFTLADVNYLGYAKSKLLTALKYLQDIDEARARHAEIVRPLYNTLDNISMCTVKRLFIIMLTFDRLGVIEGTAIVAQLLYMGGLVQ